MKQKWGVAVLGWMAGGMAFAMPETVSDTLTSCEMQEVEVLSNRATAKTPVAFTNLSKEEISRQNLGKDIPFLLMMTPSVVTTSDAGAGVGYTGMRIRGTDATRINVTANGIPLNDAESHSLYWVNMPDFASSLKDVQVQRGAGTSTNGAGAFGASVNMQTDNASYRPAAEFNGSYGSFNTHKETFKVGSGLLKDHWTFDARISNLGSEGYIDRASSHLQSFFTQAAFWADRTSVKLLVFGGKEKTYHAWNYASKEEMAEFGRRYNSCGKYTDDQGNVRFYDDQNDNYRQLHHQLLVNHSFSSAWKLNAAVHYTKGDGYYQEYKPESWLPAYGLQPIHREDGTAVEETDLIRRKQMDNYFTGLLAGVSYKKDRWDVALGGAFNYYHGDHFGEVIWVKNYTEALLPEQQYYQNLAEKTDGNMYVKGTYDWAHGWSVYADLQYRHIGYTIHGNNDKYHAATGAMQQLDVDDQFDFFNPKAGLNWDINRHNRLFVSFAVAQKEPTRNNYTDAKLNESPRSEKLLDYELGYQLQYKWLSAGANLYYMDYKDQLVLTGELNEIGEPLAANVPDSYRLGLELSLAMRFFSDKFRWDMNAAFSRNRVEDFTEVLYDDRNIAWEVYHGDTPLSFSPEVLFNNRFTFTYKGLEASLQTNYVGKQYMSNAWQAEHVLDAYSVSNLSLAYTFRPRRLKQVTVGCTVYNLFNQEYENNGYAGSGYYMENGAPVRYNYAGYAAQAGTNVLAHLSLRF